MDMGLISIQLNWKGVERTNILNKKISKYWNYSPLLKTETLGLIFYRIKLQSKINFEIAIY